MILIKNAEMFLLLFYNCDFLGGEFVELEDFYSPAMRNSNS